MITVNSTINLTNQAVPPIIPVVQGDTGRAIAFTLADFTIPAGATATYYVQKPSGEAVYNSAEISGNTVTVELTAQSIIEVGENNLQVRIILDEAVVTSFDVILMVRPFRGIGAVESETEMNIFDKAVEQAKEEIDAAAQEAEEYISQAIDDTLTIAGKAADAKATGDAINDLRADLNSVYVPNDLTWELGSLKPDTGGELSSNTRIRSPYIRVNTGDKITLSGNDNCLIVYCYALDKTYLYDSPWTIGNTYTVPEKISGTNVWYVRLLIRKSSSNPTISSDEITTLVSQCTINKVIPNSVYNFNGYSAKTDAFLAHYSYEPKTFHVNANASHSSLNDQISVEISNGEQFCVFWHRNHTNTLQFYEYDSENSGTRFFQSAEKINCHIFEASSNITKIGIYVGSNEFADDYTFLVAKANSPLFEIAKNAEELSSLIPQTYDYDTKCEEYSALFNQSGDADSFIFFADPHLLSNGDKDAFYDRFINFTNIIGGFFNRLSTTFTLCAGDWLEWTDTPNLALYKLNLMTGRMRELFGDHYYPVLGNHDTNEQGTEVDGVKRLSFDTLRNVMFPYQGLMYYSFKTTQSRFYVLNSGTDHSNDMTTDERWEQIAWLGEQLKDNDDAHSAICMHILWATTTASTLADFANNVQQLVGAYNLHSTITLNSVTYDFTSCTGKVGFILGGHLHKDQSDTTNYSVPVIATINTRNNANYPSFDLVLVDWTANTMNMVRVGNGSNQTFNLA